MANGVMLGIQIRKQQHSIQNIVFPGALGVDGCAFN